MLIQNGKATNAVLLGQTARMVSFRSGVLFANQFSLVFWQ